jgi:hypothetical protein
MQNEIVSPLPLHDARGRLSQPGWARSPLFEYRRNRVKARSFRIKEWDYYCVLNETFGAAFTIADNGYMGFIGVTVFDFENPGEETRTIMTPLPLGRFKMPESSTAGDVIYRDKKNELTFLKGEGTREISVRFEDFTPGETLEGRILLKEPSSQESMVIATPFPRAPRAFYYNQKINCLPAYGELKLGSRILGFSGAPAFGVLDWGRGVWTYSNTWYWGSGSGLAGGIPFGFNIGYGFGDTSAATENMVFYDGKAHKLEDVTFHIPGTGYMDPWQFSSSDGRFEMNFTPILDRSSNTNVLIIQSDQHQVFGRFSGFAVLDDGKKIEVDNFLGFAEKVMNRW